MSLTDAEKEKLLAFLPAEYADHERLDVWIEMAQFRVSRAYFGKAYVYALSLMVAHKAAMEARGAAGDAGRITAKHEGDLSVSYAGGSATDDGDLSSTSYGQEYLSLLRQYSPRPRVTGTVMA